MFDLNWKQEAIEFFTFNKEAPFIFTAHAFWIFFGMVLAVDVFIYKKRAWRHLFLFAASLFFYYKTTDLFFLLLLFTAVWDFFMGKKIHNTHHPLKKKLWLAGSVIMNLAVLCYFKYAYFFTDSFNQLLDGHWRVHNWIGHWSNGFFGSHFDVDKIILPIGISFFTFQSISYTVEVFRGNLKPVKNFVDFGFFVTFFPQLVAGPIVRATDFIPQLYKEYALMRAEFGLAVFWILNGLLKKVLLADYIATRFIDRVFETPERYTGFENLSALYGYSLQVYADFSGYTDIAIGVALLMGFHLTKNFNSPYKAVNVADFWRRWHMSLSGWLRDYLYIPLGGNKSASTGMWLALGILIAFIWLMSGSLLVLGIAVAVVLTGVALSLAVKSVALFLTTNLNMMITMLVGGLWHGASWNFLIWGGLNGLGLVFYKLWKRISPWENKNTWYKRAWAIFLTFSFITFTRVWFRTGSNNAWTGLDNTHDISSEFEAGQVMLRQIFLHMDWSIVPQVVAGYWNVFCVIAIGLIIHWLPEKWKVLYRSWFIALPLWAMTFVIMLVVIFVFQLLAGGSQPFIYFQF
ncbi:MAG: MBOAT family O-acyltransferase [Flavobacteriales bacterium]|nr:MBOAT family O-acyltransferase [Flavobacteriales bacterium]